MKKQLLKLNWDSFLYDNLNKIIEGSKNYSDKISSYDYMVFDFEQTIINGDIEENLMMYMLNNFLYKLTPKEFEEIINGNIIDKNISFENNKFTILDLTHDLTELYTHLWKIKKDVNKKILKMDNYFTSFRAKLVFFYYNTQKFAKIENGRIWPTYLFQNYTQDELDYLVKNLLIEMTTHHPYDEYFISTKDLLGKTGIIKSKFRYNLKFKPEMINLFEILYENNIISNIISASPVSLINAVIKASSLKLSKDSQVFAIPNTYDKNGLIHAKVNEHAPISKNEGKTEIIKKYISPKFENKDPIAIFGDSMGDYSMLTSFENTKMNVIFNRNLNDDTKKLIDIAKKQYNTENARYFTQGYF